MTNIQQCIVSDVAGIKSNTVNCSAYNLIQDYKSKYKSDSKSNLIKQQQIKNSSIQLRAKKTLCNDSKSNLIKPQIKDLSN